MIFKKLSQSIFNSSKIAFIESLYYTVGLYYQQKFLNFIQGDNII